MGIWIFLAESMWEAQKQVDSHNNQQELQRNISTRMMIHFLSRWDWWWWLEQNIAKKKHNEKTLFELSEIGLTVQAKKYWKKKTYKILTASSQKATGLLQNCHIESQWNLTQRKTKQYRQTSIDKSQIRFKKYLYNVSENSTMGMYLQHCISSKAIPHLFHCTWRFIICDL